WKLRVGSAEIALNASRFARVPSSRYLAVAGPKERSRRSRAAARTAAGAAGDRRGFLAPQAGAETAAPRVPAVVRDRRVPDAALAGRADRRDPPAPAKQIAQLPVSIRGGQAGQVGRVTQPHAVPIDEQHRRAGGAAGDHDRVVSGELARDGELDGGERGGEAPRQRRLVPPGRLR